MYILKVVGQQLIYTYFFEIGRKYEGFKKCQYGRDGNTL